MRHQTVCTVVVLLISLITTAAGGPVGFLSVDHPLAGPNGATQLFKVDDGIATGSYYNPTNNTSGSFFYQWDSGVFSPVLHPDAAEGQTVIQGIGGNATAGYYSSSTVTGHYRGFLLNGSTFTNFDYPAGPGVAVNTYPHAIDANTIVGSYDSQGAVRGFIRTPSGTFSSLQYPGSTHTTAMGLDGDRIVGYFQNEFPSATGFLFDGSVWTELAYPSAQRTRAFDIDGNFIVGEFDAGPFGSGNFRGFIHDLANHSWEPFDANPSSATTISGIDGELMVGWYIDAGGTVHGFVSTIPEPATIVMVLGVWITLGRVGNPERRRFVRNSPQI